MCFFITAPKTTIPIRMFATMPVHAVLLCPIFILNLPTELKSSPFKKIKSWKPNIIKKSLIKEVYQANIWQLSSVYKNGLR
jgi:hypothetical protein